MSNVYTILTKARELAESQRALLEERLAARERAVEGLEAELASRKDYEEMRRELNVLKMIEFGGAGLDGSGQPLELLLLDKNRQLVNENTQIKNKLSELNRQFDLVCLLVVYCCGQPAVAVNYFCGFMICSLV